MKKAILLFIILLGLLPNQKNGKFIITCNQANAQASTGIVYMYNYNYQEYYPVGSSGNNNDYFEVINGGGYYFETPHGVGPSINNTQVAIQPPGQMSGNGGGGGSMGDEDVDIDFGEDPFDDDPGGLVFTNTGTNVNPNPFRFYDCAGVENGTAYLDSCRTCVEGTTGLLPCDCNGDQGGSAYINPCGYCVGGNTGVQNTCDSTVIKYYLTVNNEYKRYYKGDKIIVPTSNMPLQLKIHQLNAADPPPIDLVWKRSDTLKCTNQILCDVIVNQTGNTIIKVDSATKNLIKNELVVYDKSVVFFHRKERNFGGAYNGEYGFDEVGYKYPMISADYEKMNIAGANYNVNWLGVLHDSTAVIKLDPKLKRGDRTDTFWVTFKSTNPKIKINDTSSLKITGNVLDTMKTLRITSRSFDTANHSIQQESILVINKYGDTIGKLKVSCQEPKLRKVVFVTVKTGASYRTDVDKDILLNWLNNRSYNQVFRKFKVDIRFSDTLNLQNEFRDSSHLFQYSNFLENLKILYGRHKHISMDSLNHDKFTQLADTTGVRFFFITDLSIVDDLNQPVKGQSNDFGFYGSLELVSDPIDVYRVVVHEMGHISGQKHTFDPYPAPQIPQFDTKNFMDYVEPTRAVDERDMFFLYQRNDPTYYIR